MATDIFELQGNQYLGCQIREVLSLPAASDQTAEADAQAGALAVRFTQLLTELHKLCHDGRVVAELLWVTEPVELQAFRAQIRQFVVLRKIGTHREQIVKEVDELSENLRFMLDANQFALCDVAFSSDSFQRLLAGIDTQCLYAVVKAERQAANTSSPYPYYYWDVVPGGNRDNFRSLIASMSQLPHCALSIQLLPVSMTQEEALLLNESAAQLLRIADGYLAAPQQYLRDQSAELPGRVYSYYNERCNAPLFQYNILAFGSQQACNTLAVKTISLLQSGSDKLVNSDFACMNLSAEQVSLPKQFATYSWNINRKLIYQYRNKQLLQTLPLAAKLFRMPYLLSVEEASAIFRLPLHETSMPALRRNQARSVAEQFSAAVIGEDTIRFGQLYASGAEQMVLGCRPSAFTKHALIVGMPGTGKTTFSINLLLQFAQKGIPFLAIEPTKTEYRAMIDAVPGLRVFTPGNNAVSPFIINPFLPPRGVRIEQYIPSLSNAFNAAFSMPSPLDAIFLKAIRACYSEYGWKDYSMLGDEDVQLFGLYEFVLVFKRLIGGMGYSGEVRGNIESAGLLRLTNLIEQNSNIYDTIHTIPIEDLLETSTVLELNSIDNPEQKALIMALLLINICVFTKTNHVSGGAIRNIILIDEAHVLLEDRGAGGDEAKADSRGTTVRVLQNMIAEIRSYGTGIIIADQTPSRIGRTIIANTDIKVAFRLVEAAEKQLIADSTDMDEDARANLSRLRIGEAYFYFSQLRAPQQIITEDIRKNRSVRLSVSNEEIVRRLTYWDTRKMKLRPYRECDYCHACDGLGCDFILRARADHIATKLLNDHRKQITDKASLMKYVYNLPHLANALLSRYTDAPRERMIGCAKIRFIRKAQLETNLLLSGREWKQVMQQALQQ